MGLVVTFPPYQIFLREGLCFYFQGGDKVLTFCDNMPQNQDTYIYLADTYFQSALQMSTFKHLNKLCNIMVLKMEKVNNPCLNIIWL